MRRRWTAAHWLGVSMTSLFLAGVLYIIGLWIVFMVLDLRKLCTLVHNVPFDPPGPPHSDLTWPLSKKCNPDYDLVPAYVNSGFITFWTIGFLAFVGSVVHAASDLYAHLRRSRRSLNDDVT